jgi:hypothetical protein
MLSSDLFNIVKPFAWMALVAFLVGFASFFLFGEPTQTFGQEPASWPAAVSGPSSDDWNVVKHI